MKIKIKPITMTADEIYVSISVTGSVAVIHVSLAWANGYQETQQLIISGPEYDIWGEDDNYIYDLVLQKLGYERA